MDINTSKGRYVLAVSGGVDSMVLLHLLNQKPGVDLIIGHFNHGIRSDSYLDEKLVKVAAKQYDLPLVVGHAQLGQKASEEQARKARYTFLESVRNNLKAKSIITAHHQDDLIETALLNLLRGTGRKGLTAISDNPKAIRPLLRYPKKDIILYAKKQALKWREDGTNQDTTYLRNYVRLVLLPELSVSKRSNFLSNLDKVAKTNKELDKLIATLSQNVVNRQGEIRRNTFVSLPSEVSRELVMHWLRQQNLRNYDQKTVNRLNNVIKTAASNTKHEVAKGKVLIIESNTAHFSNT